MGEGLKFGGFSVWFGENLKPKLNICGIVGGLGSLTFPPNEHTHKVGGGGGQTDGQTEILPSLGRLCTA